MKWLSVPAAFLAVFWASACVSDSTNTPDSGAPDTGGDTVTPDSSAETGILDGSGDGFDGARPVPPATGKFLWESVGFGQAEESIAYDNAGNLFFAFQFYTPTTVFNSTTYTSAGLYDVILVKFDGTGKVLWVRQYGGANEEDLSGLAVDGAGDVYVALASNSPSFSLGNGVTFTRQGTGYDGFVAKLKGSNGDGVWLSNLTNPSDTYNRPGALAYGGGRLGLSDYSIKGMALTKVSDSTQLLVPCLECAGSPQGNNMYLASLDPATGKAYWGTVIAATSSTAVEALAVDSKGAVVVSFTSFGPTVHDPTNSINLVYQGLGGTSTLVAKLAPANGLGSWIKQFGDFASNNNNQAEPGGVAFDSSDNVVLGAKVLGTINFGTIQLKAGGYPNYDVVVAKLKAGFGDVISARTFGGTLEDDQASVAVDPWDEVIVAGGYQSADAKLDANAFPAVPSTFVGTYIGKLDPNAQGLWATGIVSSTTSVDPRAYPSAVAVDPSTGNIAVTGLFSGTVDLGDGNPVVSPSGQTANYVVVRKP